MNACSVAYPSSTLHITLLLLCGGPVACGMQLFPCHCIYVLAPLPVHCAAAVAALLAAMFRVGCRNIGQFHVYGAD